MSDEWDCSVSMPIVFIVFGIMTGVLFLIPLFVFLPFTIIFGFIKPRSRVKQASPEFLVVMIVACCIGYGSTYTWYVGTATGREVCVVVHWLPTDSDGDGDGGGGGSHNEIVMILGMASRKRLLVTFKVGYLVLLHFYS
jgi:hypothetical protein